MDFVFGSRTNDLPHISLCDVVMLSMSSEWSDGQEVSLD